MAIGDGASRGSAAARVVLHEIAHPSSNANHVNLAFRAAIDDLAGLAAVEALRPGNYP